MTGLRTTTLIACTSAAMLLLSACSSMWSELTGHNTRRGVSSSLVDFLYPSGQQPPPVDQSAPHLQLPLRVGLAFVPSNETTTEGLSEAHKAQLLEKVRDAFEDRDYISEIVTIPDTYLRSRRGFETVEQVSRLYGLDVIALISYDQIVHLDDTKGSLAYWTIVGAFFIEGSKNDVQTFVDTAVFDVPTHKLLLRAPGVDRIESTATLINSPEETRKNREQSFANAIDDMTHNLDEELKRFTKRVQERPEVTVSHRSSYGGGGSDLIAVLALLVSLAWARIAGNNRRRLPDSD